MLTTQIQAKFIVHCVSKTTLTLHTIVSTRINRLW